MTPYIAFYIYLVIFISCPIVAVRGIWKRKPDMLAAAVPTFLLAFIGLSTNWVGWLREFAALYGIVFNG